MLVPNLRPIASACAAGVFTQAPVEMSGVLATLSWSSFGSSQPALPWYQAAAVSADEVASPLRAPIALVMRASSVPGAMFVAKAVAA